MKAGHEAIIPRDGLADVLKWLDWIHAHLPCTTYHFEPPRFYIRFGDEEEALLFRLRWL